MGEGNRFRDEEPEFGQKDSYELGELDPEGMIGQRMDDEYWEDRRSGSVAESDYRRAVAKGDDATAERALNALKGMYGEDYTPPEQ